MTVSDIAALNSGQKVYFPTIDITATVLKVNADDQEQAKIYNKQTVRSVSLQFTDYVVTCLWEDLIVANATIVV